MKLTLISKHWLRSANFSLSSPSWLTHLGESTVRPGWLNPTIFLMLSLSLMVGIVLWLIDPHTYPLTTIQVTGHLYSTSPPLAATLQTIAMGSFLTLDLAAIRATLVTLPWIKDAQLQRRWPNTLLIEVQEYHPLAVWQPTPLPSNATNHNNVVATDFKVSTTLVDTTGQLFKVPSIPVTDTLPLPVFTGSVSCVQEMINRYHQFQPAVQSAGFWITALGCNARQAWYLTLDKGITLLLGRGKIEPRLQRFLTVSAQLLKGVKNFSGSNERAMTIDLRYTNGLAVPVDTLKIITPKLDSSQNVKPTSTIE